MNEKKIPVVMTASGRVKEYPAGSSLREVLEAVFNQHSRGADYDRPVKLFLGGEAVVAEGLSEIAVEFGEIKEQKCEELDASLEEWIKQRFSGKTESETE